MLSPVSTTPLINCSLVSTTPPIKFSTTGRRSRPRPPKLSLEQPWKGAKAPQDTLVRGPGGRQNYFKPKRHYLVLAAPGASYQDVWGVYRCNFSWWLQWHCWQPWPTSAAGDIADLSPSTFFYLWQFPTSIASLFLAPAIIYHLCRCHRR